MTLSATPFRRLSLDPVHLVAQGRELGRLEKVDLPGLDPEVGEDQKPIAVSSTGQPSGSDAG